MSNGFFSITPRNKEYMKFAVSGIPLKVIQSKGVSTSPHIKFTESELNDGAKKFHNNSGKSDSFSIEILVRDTDEIMGKFTVNPSIDVNWWDESLEDETTEVLEAGWEKYVIGKHIKVMDILDYFIREAEPFYVTTRAVGIKDKELWLITENKNRVQNYDDGYTIWDLTFTKYLESDYAVFQNTNAGVKNAIKKYKKSKNKKKAKAKSKTTSKSKLEKKCNVSKLKFSKKKSDVTCVRYMQRILYNKGCFKPNKKSQIDGWFSTKTKDAVTRFQRKYKKKYKLKVNGKVDKATFKAMCKV